MLDLDWDALQAAITEWITHGRQRDQLRQELYARYTVHLLQLDLDALERRLAEVNHDLLASGVVQASGRLPYAQEGQPTRPQARRGRL